MSGIILGSYGYQRSGKTLVAYLLAEKYRNQGCKVYSNMDVPGWNKIYSLTDLPFDYEPKVLLLDEVYYFMDSRNWKNNTNSTIFFNTIGKQNILLLLTSITPDMVDIRLRQQHNYVYLVKSDADFIHYMIKDIIRNRVKTFCIRKTPELYKNLRYDHEQVPDPVDCSLKNFAEKVKAVNQQRHCPSPDLHENERRKERRSI